MPTTTKKDLIDRIAEETDQKRTAVKKTVQSFLDNVIRELVNELTEPRLIKSNPAPYLRRTSIRMR